MGVAQYYTLVNFLASAESLKDRPIVILIQPHISMSFFSSDYLNPPDQKRCTTEFETIAKVFSSNIEWRMRYWRRLQKWKFDEAGITVLSHSNGTVRLLFALATSIWHWRGNRWCTVGCSKLIQNTFRDHASSIPSVSVRILYLCYDEQVYWCPAIGLWEPFVAFGFLYSTPRTPIEYLMRFVWLTLLAYACTDEHADITYLEN